ncbi:phage head closure protein [Burkholderia pseudomallei]|uniref:phage head closure protein n=1 Tax=Burkholderia pseudomallei TaxID=28450 RepID=UPI0019FAF3FC|nr:phage head closure protein [Burkholderia pseudomallei]MBF3779560.1 phage head closure protein [Burkholderia pseudomallei]MBF4041887.1 phage head closure protein [Burkholderia pseudomallei]
MTAPLRAGQLTRYVDVQQRNPATFDEIGQPLNTWMTLKSVYAEIEALSAFKRAIAGLVVTDVTHQITVRYDAIFANPRIAGTYRIVYAGRIFEVLGVENVDEGNQMIVLSAREGLNNG